MNDHPLTLQVKRIWPVLAGAAVVALALLILMLVIRARSHVPVAQFTRDAAALRDAPWYTGLISQAGLMAWAAAAALAWLGAVLAVGRTQRAFSIFLVGGGVISLWLGVDDALMLHELLIPRNVGISETMVYALYIVVVLMFLAVCWRQLLQSDWLLLAIALAFFALPVVADMLMANGSRVTALMSSAKLAGILSWTGYWGSAAAQAGRQKITRVG